MVQAACLHELAEIVKRWADSGHNCARGIPRRAIVSVLLSCWANYLFALRIRIWVG